VDSTAPPWISKNLQSDNSNTYFVAFEESKSLTGAKAASLDSASSEGVKWLKGSQEFPGQPEIPRTLLELVKHTAEVTDTWFTYDRSKGVYRYYTSLRLPNEFRKLDLKSLMPVGVSLPNDSASRVEGTGLTLLLKHMGFAPVSADVYVLSGDPQGPESIQPYSHDRKLADKYVAKFKTLLPSCKGGGPTNISGYSVWCFHVESDEINRKSGKIQELGVVTANGHPLDVFAVDFSDQKPIIDFEVRAVK